VLEIPHEGNDHEETVSIEPSLALAALQTQENEAGND